MARRTQPSSVEDDFPPGIYLTDGESLFNVVSTLPHEPSLRLIEDCGTLEILMVHVDGLRAPVVRRVEMDDEPSLDDPPDAFGDVEPAPMRRRPMGARH